MASRIDLRCQDVAAMLASLPDGCAALVHADPPWLFRQGMTTGRGAAAAHYICTDEAPIVADLHAAYRVAAPDAYLTVWAVFPKLAEWMAAWAMHEALMKLQDCPTWHYVSGGAWGKTNGLGVGYHFRGDAELLLLYKKGNPTPRGGSKSNLWLAERIGHSEKPQTALRALVAMGAPIGGLVVDCYAGESASLALACRALNREYIGAELDSARHRRALARLSQQEMAWEVPA